MNTFEISFLFLIIIGIASCKDHNFTQQKNTSIQTDSSAAIQYATGFKIKYSVNCKIVEIYSPRDSALLQKYILYRDRIPSNLVDTSSTINIKIPVKSVVCLSTTHLAFLEKLNLLDVVKGIASKDQVNNEIVLTKRADGSIIEIGEADQIQFEKLTELHPDLIFSYEIPGYASIGRSLINKLKIPQLTVLEFLETQPLGQLEWIKFFGAFFDKEEMANHIFDSIVKEYDILKELASTVKNKPTVITSLPWKGQWHIASGNSHVAKYIEDAGGISMMENSLSDGNLVLSIEAVYEKAMRADYWINTGIANTTNDVKNADQRLAKIKALKNGNVYNNNSRCNENNFSDYYESGVVNPHHILKDLIKIFHPELLPDHQLYYYKKLE
jgi:iron complex transport system substrate-binding protein